MMTHMQAFLFLQCCCCVIANLVEQPAPTFPSPGSPSGMDDEPSPAPEVEPAPSPEPSKLSCYNEEHDKLNCDRHNPTVTGADGTEKSCSCEFNCDTTPFGCCDDYKKYCDCHCPIGFYRHQGCAKNECHPCSTPESVKLGNGETKDFYWTSGGGGGDPSKGNEDTCSYVLCDSEEAKCPESGRPPRTCGDAHSHGLCRQHVKQTTSLGTTFRAPAPTTTETTTEETSTTAATTTTTMPKTTTDPELHHCKHKLMSNLPTFILKEPTSVNCDEMFCEHNFECYQSVQAGLDCTGCEMCKSGVTRANCPGFVYPAPAPTTTTKTSTTTTIMTETTIETTITKTKTATTQRASTGSHPGSITNSHFSTRQSESTRVTATSKVQEKTEAITKQELSAASTMAISSGSTWPASTSDREIATSNQKAKISQVLRSTTGMPNELVSGKKVEQATTPLPPTTNGLALSGDGPFDFSKQTNVYIWAGSIGGVVLLVIIVAVAVMLVRRRKAGFQQVDDENFLSLIEVNNRKNGFAQI